MRTTLYGGVRIVDHPDPGNVYKLDLQCLPMIYEFHRHGLLADRERFAQLEVVLNAEILDLNEKLAIEAGWEVNAASSDDVRRLLIRELGLSAPLGFHMTRSGHISMDSELLRSMRGQHPAVDMILRIRELRKLLNTYVAKLPQMLNAEGRLRTTFRHTSTETGRLSSENPNLQNIPARTKTGIEIRNCFRAAPGNLLVSCDLSQIEMVLAGHLSGDENMLRAFRDGSDIHTLTAVAAFCLPDSERSYYIRLSDMARREENGEAVVWTEDERRDWKQFKQQKRLPAKTVGFGILYGQTAPGAQWNIVDQGGPVLSIEACESIISGFFCAYPGIRNWMREQESRARTRGMVWDMFGRVRMLPAAMSEIPRIARKAVREAGNMPIQSSAQGIIKLAMAEATELVKRYRRQNHVVMPLLQIHDELVFEVSEDCAERFAADLRDIMIGCVDLRVPHSASYSVAERWGELK